MSLLLRRSLSGLVLGLFLVVAGAHAQWKLPGGITVQTPKIPQQRNAPARNSQPTRQKVDVDSICPKVIEWSQHLNTEYPNLDFNHMPMNRAQLLAIPLFGEPLFSQYFGTPYEQLDATARQKMLMEKVRPCVTATGYRSQLTFASVALQPAWYATGVQIVSPSRLVPELTSLRQARAALVQFQSQLDALPAGADSYDRAKDIQKSAATSLDQVWPSERAAFQADAKTQIGKLAAPALAAKVDTLVAQANGYDGAVALKQAPQKYGDLWHAVPAEQQTAYQEQLDRKGEQIIKPLLAEERAKMLTVTLGPQHLADGAQWLSAFSDHYVKVLSSPDAEEIATQFRKRRNAQLTAALPEITRKVQAARTADAMNTVLAQCCALSEDHDVPGYARLQGIVDQKTATIAQHDELAARTDAKQRALGSQYQQGNRAIQPDETASSGDAPTHPHTHLGGLSKASPDGGPSASEIYDALQGKLDQYNEHVRDVQQQCAHLNSNSPQDPILGIQCMQSMLMKSQGSSNDQQASITGLQRLGCTKAEGHVGYMCEYIASMSVNVPLPPSMKGLMEGGQVTEARFVHMQNGWMMVGN
jgi:hypothetical protein